MQYDSPYARRRAAVLIGAMAGALIGTWAASAHDRNGRSTELGIVRVMPEAPRGHAVLRLAGMGPLSWTVTANAEAQAWFDQGLNLAWGFNHAEAVRAFRSGQAADPGCAMCFWGEAWALGPNINAPMAPGALPQAREAIARARAAAGGASAAERALIDAMAERYGPDALVDPAAAATAYAEAMRTVAARFPADREITLLAADALMNLSPWDYWAEGGRVAKGATEEIIAHLEAVLGLVPRPGLVPAPDHVGAIHLYIHMVEASDRPERALPVAERLASLAPAAGHLVHMGSHILYRVGRYKESLALNREAVAADRAYIAAAAPEGLYPQAYYPHNIHMLLASAQMAGDAATVLAAADELAATVTEDAARDIAWVQPIMAAPWFALAQFGTSDAILGTHHSDGGLPYVQAARRYARAIGLARAGDTAAASGERDELARLAEAPEIAALEQGGVPARALISLMGAVAEGRIAQAEGRASDAIAAFREAASIEEGLPYTEPPFWYYPVRQSLGAALLSAGDIAGAEAAFRDSLRGAPRNGWALWGLAEAARRRNDAAAAEEAERLLSEAWVGERSLLRLERL
ncbi:tetratricopeptide repeat protein [Elioraea rosea]|uniref:hypothetical protein n=1 Tax=Elioraea rosea TaxID=2492390 RepID=UPI001183DE99|nr:hypothetical protein [Elioraea rosea]